MIQPSTPTGNPAGGNATGTDGADPSMEEILASIRRILNEDETAAEAETPTLEEPPADDDVLVLDRSMLVAAPEPAAAEPEPPLPKPPLPQPPAAVDHAEPEPISFEPDIEPTMPPPVVAMPPASPPPVDNTLLAPETAAAAASSMDGLLRSLAASRTTQVYRGGPTIEDVVREEVRPLLKDWLDTNLPPLVERLVRAEIERLVARAVP